MDDREYALYKGEELLRKKHWSEHMNKSIKNLCIDCQLKQKAKNSILCTDCKQKRLLDNYKDIDVDTQANKYF